MNKSVSYKKYLPDLFAIIAFILISFLYFAPAIMDGRVLAQHDSQAAIGQGQEQREFMEKHGERTRWINSMFGGMPTYQMTPTYASTLLQDAAKKVYSLFLPNYMYLIFIMLLGFYILMRAFKANPLISALGAILWTFSSYYFIIIAAGHIWKFITLAYIPPTIAGLVYAYRKKYVLGALLVMIFVAFQISANHIQMSYYFLFVMLFMVIAYFVDALKNKTLPDFFKATGVIVLAGIIGVLANSSNLYHTYEYSKETMRGKSELTHHNADNKTNNGLEKDYITAWSYGIGETWTLLVPNTKGGASVPLSENEIAMKKADPNFREIYSQIGQYWGEQPGTSGPVYVGAFVLTLFILGMFLLEGSFKWAMLAATIFSILLSWGKNFMGLTDFFIDYVPMYNKFRTVASILVIAEFAIPLIAALTIKEIVEHPEKLKQNLKYLWISLGMTGFIALLFAVAPRMFFSSYVSSGEMQALQTLPSEYIRPVTDNLTQMRIAMFTADAWRTVIIIAIGTALLLAFNSGKLKSKWMVTGVLVLCLIDMWGVNKRYLNDSMFVPKSNLNQTFAKSQADEIILQDKDKNYRVLNMATSTFNDGVTPYWHQCIGGYHPAKLRRYQDIIDVYLTKEMGALQQDIIKSQGRMDSVNTEGFKVLNMLNTKWVIMPGQDGSQIPVPNPYNQGNAWFVNKINFVNTPDEEIAALAKMDLKNEAVADKKYQSVLNGFNVTPKDSASQIAIESFDSNIITYKTSTNKPELAVFSEIYYPEGWNITIDGKPAEMLRANYTLRALPIPSGNHTVIFKFEPKSIKITDTIAFIALAIMVLTAGYLLWTRYKEERKEVK